MNILTVNGLAFRIPETPSRYRGNCHKDWGVFITGETKGMNILKATEAGLTKGNFVEMAICWVDQKILTFEPHFINEEFTEIWGIPVAGEMKTQFAEKASELSTFLLHRQSKDKMQGLIDIFSRNAFNDWVLGGMQGSAEEYAQKKASEYYFSNIFHFEMTPTESSNYGAYFYVKTTIRQPQSELDFAALECAKQIYQAQLEGNGYCTDPRLEENQIKCLESSTQIESEPKKVITLPANNKQKKLTAK